MLKMPYVDRFYLTYILFNGLNVWKIPYFFNI